MPTTTTRPARLPPINKTACSGAAGARALRITYEARPETPPQVGALEFSAEGLFKGLRPSKALQCILGFHGTPAQQEAGFITWLNANLNGYQFSKDIQDQAAEGKEMGDQVKDLDGALNKLFKDGAVDAKEAEIRKLADQKPEDIGNALAELFKEIGDVSLGSLVDSLKDVKDAASKVVDSIPFLGVITAGVKLLVQGIQMGLLVQEAYKIHKYKSDSFSIIELETMGAIQYFEKKDAALRSKDMVATAATGAASAFGAGAIASAANALISLLTTIVIRIIEYLEFLEANTAMATRTLTIDKLRTKPSLGLYLPHISGVDTLTLLGVLPVGWRESEKNQKIKDGLNAIMTAKAGRVNAFNMGWLTHSLQWDNANSEYRAPDSSGLGGMAVAVASAATPLKENPWKMEYERILYVLEKTDKYLYTQSWKLVKGQQVLHEPRPTGIVDKFKDASKELMMDAKTRAMLKLKTTFTETTGATSTKPPAKLSPLKGTGNQP
ncbi:MAG: hypothetical protein IT270_01660 [Saprospiraceae bacterium]|nr:hypothetical protein [Saprospiraceae bacterium]